MKHVRFTFRQLTFAVANEAINRKLEFALKQALEIVKEPTDGN
ncbi:MAG TPA: hypothetical protein VN951_00070 [Pyrinomonadaceae bacterium]|nr:hypothetical protein [Pyrinomonadaceae bacterium]